MPNDLILSKQGISFTPESIPVIREWVAFCKKKAGLAYLMCSLDSEGEPDVSLAGDNKIISGAILDELVDIQFYWRIHQHAFELLKKNYCVNAERGEKTKVILKEEK